MRPFAVYCPARVPRDEPVYSPNGRKHTERECGGKLGKVTGCNGLREPANIFERKCPECGAEWDIHVELSKENPARRLHPTQAVTIYKAGMKTGMFADYFTVCVAIKPPPEDLIEDLGWDLKVALDEQQRANEKVMKIQTELARLRAVASPRDTPAPRTVRKPRTPGTVPASR